MSRKRPAVSPEEHALFLDAIEGATPLLGRDRVSVVKPPASVARVAILPPEISLTVEGDGHRYAARAPGVSHAQLSQLRRGKVHVEETLDLHGSPSSGPYGTGGVERGIARLRAFLIEANRIGRRCVLVVHGKGTHSEHGAPLREAVLGQLLGECSGFVHAMSTAAPADGGDGATYVMMRGGR